MGMGKERDTHLQVCLSASWLCISLPDLLPQCSGEQELLLGHEGPTVGKQSRRKQCRCHLQSRTSENWKDGVRVQA